MKLSPDEIANNQLHPDTLEFAVQQIRINGFVVFESALPSDYVETLRSDYMDLYHEALKNPPDETFGNNHYRLYLPFRKPYTDEQIILNPFVIPIVEKLLGDDMVCHYFASNTCAPGSEYQDTHSDTYTLFSEQDVSLPPYMIVFNVPLVDTTEENGPMQYWYGGSHHITPTRDKMEQFEEILPSAHATMPAGSIMIRDGRMWHRGTRNRSDHPRPNIAVVYSRPWLASGPRRIGIPQTTYDNLPKQAQEIFRGENIGGDLDQPW